MIVGGIVIVFLTLVNWKKSRGCEANFKMCF